MVSEEKENSTMKMEEIYLSTLSWVDIYCDTLAREKSNFTINRRRTFSLKSSLRISFTKRIKLKFSHEKFSSSLRRDVLKIFWSGNKS